MCAIPFVLPLFLLVRKDTKKAESHFAFKVIRLVRFHSFFVFPTETSWQRENGFLKDNIGLKLESKLC